VYPGRPVATLTLHPRLVRRTLAWASGAADKLAVEVKLNATGLRLLAKTLGGSIGTHAKTLRLGHRRAAAACKFLRARGRRTPPCGAAHSTVAWSWRSAGARRDLPGEHARP
jgi:hypothetical protein